MGDITIGQYYNTNSIIHRLDPRVKLLSTLAYLVSLFFAKTLFGYLFSFVFLIAIIFLSKIPIKYLVKGLKTIIFLIFLTCFFNLFLTDGKVLVKVWKLSITDNGLRNAFFMTIRLMLLIVGASILTLTSTPNSLTASLESLLKPLKFFKVPVSELSMMMSIALRFIPILLEETQKIMNAQKARGASFDEGSLLTKAKALVPVLIPLFISSFKRADDLANAMESRCYLPNKNRTKLNPLKFYKRDYLGFAIIILYFTLSILISIFFKLKIWIF